MLGNWLYGVAYRTAHNLRIATAKRQAKEKQISMVSDPVAPQERDWQEIAPLIDRELNRLPEMYRAAVICCDLQGHTRADAARQLGWPEGTLKVRLMRARSILAKRLTRQGVALSAGTLAVVLSQKRPRPPCRPRSCHRQRKPPAHLPQRRGIDFGGSQDGRPREGCCQIALPRGRRSLL